MPAIANSNAGHFRFIRDDDDHHEEDADDTIHVLAIVLAIIVALGVLLFGALQVLKRTRRQRSERDNSSNTNSPPQYNDVVQHDKNHHRLTIETHNGATRTSIVYSKDRRPMLANPNSPPHSPDNVPEIHITFPDEEVDGEGGSKRKSGRVVVVRVGEGAGAVGLEPLDEDELPAYEKESNGSFYSIDMNDIGGLREKEREDYR